MDKYYIKIIVEGNEEEAFFDIVKQIGTNEKFHLEIGNAEGFGGIANAFLDALRDEYYDCIVCVYDVDNRLNEKDSPYNTIRKQLVSILGDEVVADAVSFCTNPNILQYFLLAADTLDKVKLTSSSKTINSKYVHKYWKDIDSGKKDKQGHEIKTHYDAVKWQLDIMKYSIINDGYHYSTLLENATSLSLDYKNELPAGNLLPMLMALKSGDKDFFNKIQILVANIQN